MVEGIHLQVNINTALELSKTASDLQGAMAAQQTNTDRVLREESLRKADQVNTMDQSTKLNEDGGGSGASGGKFWGKEEKEQGKETKPKDPHRGNLLDITR
ncbi:MAG: hypothetical protein AB1765_12410 [Candidatus Hydrogenedentota bacterium]